MVRKTFALVALIALLCGVSYTSLAGTGIVGLVHPGGRQTSNDLGYPYFHIKTLKAGASGGGAFIASYANWDTLRIGRDFNANGVIDSTFTAGETYSTDYMPIRKVQYIWNGSVPDTLFLRFLDSSKPAVVLGTIKIASPTSDVEEFPIQCSRVAVSGGRTNVAGNWIVIAYASP